MHNPKRPLHSAALEDELKQRDDRIGELRADLDRAEQLVWEMREHVEDASTLIDSWIEAFDMVQDDDGAWKWSTAFVESHEWFKKYDALVTKWNGSCPSGTRSCAHATSGDHSPPATPRSPRC
jgi:hypothetical protein